ncbi:UDP-glucose/GDP-mannose dehydrogenase family protein [Paenibacillus sp. LHD-117]|uniref:UDP-glucose dehydrogenase family protein n=1 Tax=Paenibacillus sp. LHD-117 TaxID=3071412 RepID=UPI0027DF66FF|nr:UDP-glucose/GDP-mannose dehydrogenase family protein [Paenibacillus sp. LHD-117]MDQ6421779.1 UDP-glucose/GDP-mannose dehydrogenase family protein [Paenibacillus sp. LHD-117]
MNICIVGAGYVGLTTAAVLSELGHTVHCADRDEGKIAMLGKGQIPIYEPGLLELISRNADQGRLSFSSDVTACMEEHDLIMIAVGTPSAADGTADLVYVRSVLLAISTVLNKHKIIVMKSTVPPGTGKWAEQFLMDRGIPAALFDIVSNPEFLREGTAIHDTLHPDRLVIGTKSTAAAERVRALYEGIQSETVITGQTEAELIKYGSNAFLATKLSFVNELSRVCDAFDADVTMVAHGIGMDSRIGSKFLQAGIGYGGSCLPKDVNALIGAAASKEIRLNLLREVAAVNDTQPDYYIGKLENTIGAIDENTRIAVWGATFKENTDDIRYSQAIELMKRLAAKGCTVTAFDPLVSPSIPGVNWAKSLADATEGADALIVATGWKEFLEADWKSILARMRGSVVMDGRNVLDQSLIAEAGLTYLGVGRP